MQVKTILNQLEKFKCFVYGKQELVEELGRLVLLIHLLPRANSKAICSRCGRAYPAYDTLEPRRFEYVPLWGIRVFFIYAMRRVWCSKCGVAVERVPWAEGKEHQTKTYQWFLARWAKRMSWKEVAEAFQTTWEHVYLSVQMAVHWGLEHRKLDGITAIGVDEVQYRRGHKYVTVVYQLDQGCKRLLWLGKDRTAKTLLRFFHWLNPERSARLKFVCSDMWKPYLEVIARKAKQALNVLDRYHIVALINKAIDKVRAKEAKELQEKGYEPVLKHTRWCLLKRPEHLTDKQDIKLRELVKYNLKTVRAYLLKEDLQLHFWDYVKPAWAERFLQSWCTKVMRSRLEPLKRLARTLRQHMPLIMNWFKARERISLGAVEGLNNKEKVITRRAYGFRSYEVLEIALYHGMGELPEPAFTHRFC